MFPPFFKYVLNTAWLPHQIFHHHNFKIKRISLEDVQKQFRILLNVPDYQQVVVKIQPSWETTL